jgi:hypothetical protein
MPLSLISDQLHDIFLPFKSNLSAVPYIIQIKSLVFLAFIFICVINGTADRLDLKGRNISCDWQIKSTGIKVYWINLDERLQRRVLMEKQMNDVGLLHKRVSAITPNSPRFNISVLEKPCKRNTDKDLAVILSHLTAIREAVYDSDGDLNYALILEARCFHSRQFYINRIQ